MRILVAEDDPTSRRMLEATLRKLGYEVLCASDGRQAWEALQEKDAPNIVLLDWMMPEMDGLEVCRKLRKEKPDGITYIILVTALGTKENIVEGLKSGADDYVTKPFHREELLARIQVGERVVGLQSALKTRLAELQEAMDHIKTLQGILPICAYCHKIRTDPKSWERMEKYIEEHSKAKFSHGICPDCMKKHFPEIKGEEDAPED